MRPLKPYELVWRDCDEREDPEYWYRRVILKNVRYNRHQAKRRLRTRALERKLEAASKMRDDHAGEPTDSRTLGTPQRSVEPYNATESKAETPQTKHHAFPRFGRTAEKETPRRPTSPAPTRVQPARVNGWPLVSLMMNVALVTAAVFIGEQHVVNESGAGSSSPACGTYGCFVNQFRNLNLNSLATTQAEHRKRPPSVRTYITHLHVKSSWRAARSGTIDRMTSDVLAFRPFSAVYALSFACVLTYFFLGPRAVGLQDSANAIIY
eukprot:5584859-Pleurochrysis_carterae.AAC.2